MATKKSPAVSTSTKVRNKRQYSAQEAFSKNIVDSIKSKKITFGPVVKVSGKKSGEKYTSVKNPKTGAYITCEKVKVEGSVQSRAYLTLISKGSVAGTIRTDVITGEFARKAFEAITLEPRAKKSQLSTSDISDLNSAFGF